MRILLATEGESDEVVAIRLLHHVFPRAEIQPKRMPSRGIAVVERLLEDIVRAAHFGHYELLILHFDLDETLPEPRRDVRESERWSSITNRVHDLLSNQLANQGNRSVPVHPIYMTPMQSTESWLRWAIMNGIGERWEVVDRHDLKKKLFGDPPRKIVDKAEEYSKQLQVQMAECPTWPRRLRDFHESLDAFKATFESRSLPTNS